MSKEGPNEKGDEEDLGTLLVVLLVQLLRMVGSGVAPGIEHMTMYDFDPAAQHTWLTMGKTDNVTLLDEAWAKYKLPSLIELTKSGPQSLWCFTNGTHNPLVPCGGRGSAESRTDGVLREDREFVLESMPEVTGMQRRLR